MGDLEDLKVPDLWYDLYARLLPGGAFVAVIRVLILSKIDVPSYSELLVLGAAGYFCGLLSQPIASNVARLMERLSEQWKEKDRLYVRNVQVRLGRGSREAMILSKMHGEVVFFSQLAVLSGAFGVLRWTTGPPPWLAVGANVPCLGFFVCAALEVAFRRLKRAIDDDDSIVERPSLALQPTAR